jgi:hypothetical protein
VNAHHTPDPIIPDPDLFKVFPRKVDLGNRPRGCARWSLMFGASLDLGSWILDLGSWELL